MNRAFAIALIATFSGCSSAHLDREDQSTIGEWIQNGEFEKVKAAISGKDLTTNPDLLKYTFPRSGATSEKCQDKIAELLLGNGSKVREVWDTPNESSIDKTFRSILGKKESIKDEPQHFTLAVEGHCTSIFARMLPLASDEDLTAALNIADKNMDQESTEYIKRIDSLKGLEIYKKDERTMIASLQTEMAIRCKRGVTRFCPDSGWAKKFQHIQESIDLQKAELTKRESLKLTEQENAKKAEEWLNSPEGIACDSIRQILTLTNIIEHEREVGKNSGFVRADILRDSESSLIYFRNQLKKAKLNYRKVAGKPFDQRACKRD